MNEFSKHRLNQSFLKVKDERFEFQYHIDSYETTISEVAVLTAHLPSLAFGGAAVILHYLPTNVATNFVQTYKGKECPGPFFKTNNQQRDLIPATAEIAAQLNDLNFPRFQKFSAWRNFTVRGYCVQGVPIVHVDGKLAKVTDKKAFENCNTMVVTHIEVDDKPLSGATRL